MMLWRRNCAGTGFSLGVGIDWFVRGFLKCNEKGLPNDEHKQFIPKAVERLEEETDAIPDGFSTDMGEIQADQLTREMAEAFVEKVVVWPGQKLEIRWKFKG